MRMRVAIFVALAATLIGCSKLPALSAALRPGAIESYRVLLDIDDELSQKGHYVKQYEAHRVFDIEQQILPPAAPDTRRAQIVVRRIQMQTDIVGGETVRFDSNEHSARIVDYQRPLLAMIGRPLTLTIDPTGRVTRVDGYDAILAAAKEAHPRGELAIEADDVFLTHYGPDFIADIFEIYYASLPPATKKPETLWHNSRTVYLPYVGKLAFTQTTKLEPRAENDDTGDRLTFASEFGPEDQLGQPKQPSRLGLSKGSVKGELEVDGAAGRLNRLNQLTVLFLGVESPGSGAVPARRVTMKTFIDRQ